MQVRFLELLEGLPEEVQTEILRRAYKRCVKQLEPAAEIMCGTGGRRRVNGPYNTHHEGNLSEWCDSELEAWKKAFETLKG